MLGNVVKDVAPYYSDIKTLLITITRKGHNTRSCNFQLVKTS
jgi:hypothetical protein